MSLVTIPIFVVVLSVGLASVALAAGSGSGAGGSGAQHGDGRDQNNAARLPGPPGSANNQSQRSGVASATAPAETMAVPSR